VDLYIDVVHARGADPNIGPRLPSLLHSSRLTDVCVHVVQPTGVEGEVKLLSPITFEAIVDAIVAEGLAERSDLDPLIEELWVFAATNGTVVAMPRVVQAWGRRAH
jgi:hypothetical protein